MTSSFVMPRGEKKNKGKKKEKRKRKGETDLQKETGVCLKKNLPNRILIN